jgi:hypothetical protein
MLQGRRPSKDWGEPTSRGNAGTKKSVLPGEKFSRHTIPKLHVFTKFFLKISEFPHKKGTFDVNLLFTATLACTTRALLVI